MRRTAVSPGPTYEVPHAPRWSELVLGLAINSVCALLLAIANPHFFTAPTPFVAAIDHHVTLTGPTSLTQPEPEPPNVVSAPRHLAKIESHRAATPPEEPTPIPGGPISPALEPPKLSANVPTSMPPKPAPEKQIKTDVFSVATSQSGTPHPSPNEVQTGGFGDPNGVPAENAHPTVAGTLARLGAFDLPSGAERGNGTAGSQGTSGTIAPPGSWIQQVLLIPSHKKRAPYRPLDSEASYPRQRLLPPPNRLQERPALQPVEIIYKRRPAYTAEARQQRVEGEVLLEVVFNASGSLRVNRVVKALGYGLDDMTLAAAQGIQFRPAKRKGKPYDCAALVPHYF
jgi:TonB family protein